jgi:ArgJ family protein
LKEAADQSFNNISIDGDTSTNDTALVLASGKSGVQFKSVRNEFQTALTKVCRSLAAQIVADGEGVQHVVRLTIEQARSRNEARQIGRAIANSPLVKTAWAGADPNWGRILSAIGYSGVKINPERINIYLGEQQICRHGAACTFDHSKAHSYMSEPVYEIRIALGTGNAGLEFLQYIAFSDQHSAIRQIVLTAKHAKDAKQKVSAGFPITFATFAPVAVKLFGYLPVANCFLAGVCRSLPLCVLWVESVF